MRVNIFIRRIEYIYKYYKINFNHSSDEKSLQSCQAKCEFLQNFVV